MSRAQDLAGRVVLVVEDDYFIAQDIVAALVREGATVAGPAATPVAALDILRDRPLDLAVLDIRLAEKTVWDLARTLADDGIPIVFATAYDRSVLPERFAAAPFWEKPFDSGQLARFLATLPAGQGVGA